MIYHVLYTPRPGNFFTILINLDGVVMTNQLKSFINGIGKSLEIYPHQQYIVPKRGEFRHDMQRLRGDAKRIAVDLKKAVKLYGQ